jgi:citronellol/citronellal dehydrogenase
VLNMSPPLSMREHWFKGHVAYTMAKYGMSECTLGHAGEFRPYRHRRQQPVAAHADRHRGAADDPGRGPEPVPHARDPGRRGLVDPDQRRAPARHHRGTFFIDDDLLA